FPSRTKGVIEVFEGFALFHGDLGGKNWREIVAIVWFRREHSHCGHAKEIRLIAEILHEKSLPLKNGVIVFLLIKSLEYHFRNMLSVLESSAGDMQLGYPTAAGIGP